MGAEVQRCVEGPLGAVAQGEGRMFVDGSMLANELRRRRVGPRSLAESVERVHRSTWVVGDLRSTPTSLLVLAAFSLTEPPVATTGRAASRNY